MIYRFTQIIALPDGVKLPIGDAVIVDGDLDDKNPLHNALKDAVDKGLLDGTEPKNKTNKQRTQGK